MSSAIKLLKDDHKKVSELFKKFKNAGDKAHALKRKIGDQIIEELKVHTRIEEEILYPALDALAKDKTKKMVAEAYEEHSLINELLSELKNCQPTDRKFGAKFKVVIDLVQHHVEEEENELFPNAKKLLGENDEMLGEEMQERKEELQGRKKSKNDSPLLPITY